MHSNLKTIFLAGFAVCLTLSAATGQEPAELVVKKLDAQEPTRILLKNRFLELTFDPARGGRCSRLLIRATGEQVIGDDDVSGMFLDHWAKYAWPSGLMHLPYKYELVKEGEKRAGVRLWVQVPKFGGGQGSRARTGSLKIATSPDLVGLTVRKTIWLNSDNDTIQVDQELVNTTTQSRAAALYIQQNLRMSGSHYSDNWYLPSTSGVRVNLQPDKKGGRAIGPDWIQTPVAGWMAVKDRQTQHGMVFAFDYNYLNKTYTSGATGEWFLEPVPIGPGKVFQTTYVIKPVSGFKDFVYASSALVADIQADEVGQGRVKVTHEVMAVGQDQNQVTVELQVIGWKSKKLLATKVFQVSRLSSKRLQQQLVFKPATLADGAVDFSHSPQRERTNNDTSVSMRVTAPNRRLVRISLPPRGEDCRAEEAIATFVHSRASESSSISPTSRSFHSETSKRFRCLVVFGLFTHILNLDDAVDGWKRTAMSKDAGRVHVGELPAEWSRDVPRDIR